MMIGHDDDDDRSIIMMMMVDHVDADDRSS